MPGAAGGGTGNEPDAGGRAGGAAHGGGAAASGRPGGSGPGARKWRTLEGYIGEDEVPAEFEGPGDALSGDRCRVLDAWHVVWTDGRASVPFSGGSPCSLDAALESWKGLLSTGQRRLVAFGTLRLPHPEYPGEYVPAPRQPASCPRIQIEPVVDWCVEYSMPAKIWLVTPTAWYRVLTPAREHQSRVKGMMTKFQMASRAAFGLHLGAARTFGQVLDHVCKPPEDKARHGKHPMPAGGAASQLPRGWPSMGGSRFTEADIVAQGKFLVLQLKVLEEVKAAPLCPFLTVLDKKWMARERDIGRKQVRSLLQPSKKELELAARRARAQEKEGGRAPKAGTPGLNGAVPEVGPGGEAAQSARRSSASQASGRRTAGGASGDRSGRRRSGGGKSNQDRGKVHGLAGETFRKEVKALYTDLPFVAAAKEKYRPQPLYNFIVAPELVPRLLSVWDLLSSYRELLRVPPFPFERFQRAFVNDGGEEVPIDREELARLTAPPVQTGSKPATVGTGFTCPVCGKDFKNATGLGVHCFKTGHDRYANIKQSVAASEAFKNKYALPKIPQSRYMTGPAGQGALLCDIHTALLRAIEGADLELYTAPKFAKYGAAAHLVSRGVYLPLIGVSWPAVVLQCLEDHAETQRYDQSVVAVMDSLREVDYAELIPSQRLTLLEALMQVFCHSEVYLEHVTQRLPPNHIYAAYQTPVLPPLVDQKVAESTSRVSDAAVLGPVPRGCPLGEDAKGRRYYQLGDEDCIFIEEASGMDSMSGNGTWGCYNASQIPALREWLKSGNRAEQELGDNISAGLRKPAEDDGTKADPGGQSAKAAPETLDSAAEVNAAEGNREVGEGAAPPPPVLPNIGEYSLNACIDGYCHLAEYVDPLAILKKEIASVARDFPFWECKNDRAGLLKLRTRASVLKQLSGLRSSSQLPKVLADLEGIFREQIAMKNRRWSDDCIKWNEKNARVRTVAQAAVSAATMLFSLSRSKANKAGENNTMGSEAFFNLRRKMRCGQMFIPNVGDKVALCWTGLYAHMERYMASDLSSLRENVSPQGVVEHCTVRDVVFFNEKSLSHLRNVEEGPAAAWIVVQRLAGLPESSHLSLPLFIDESTARPNEFLAPLEEYRQSLKREYHRGQRFKKYYATNDGRRTGGYFRGTILTDFNIQEEPGRDPWNALEVHWDDRPIFCSKTKVVGGSITKIKPPAPKIDYAALAEAAAEREALLASTKKRGEELLREVEEQEAKKANVDQEEPGERAPLSCPDSASPQKSTETPVGEACAPKNLREESADDIPDERTSIPTPTQSTPESKSPAAAGAQEVKVAEDARPDLQVTLRQKKRTVNVTSLYTGLEKALCPWQLVIVGPGEEMDASGPGETPEYMTSEDAVATGEIPSSPKPKLPKEDIKPIRVEISDTGDLVIKKAPGRRRNSLNYERLTARLKERYNEIVSGEGEPADREARQASLEIALDELVKGEEEAYRKEKEEILEKERLDQAEERKASGSDGAASPLAGQKRKEREDGEGNESNDASPHLARPRLNPQ